MNLQQEKLTKTPRQSAAAESLEYVLKQQEDIKKTIRLAIQSIERIDGHFDYSPTEAQEEPPISSEWNIRNFILKISRNNEQILHMLHDVNNNLNRNL